MAPVLVGTVAFQFFGGFLEGVSFGFFVHVIESALGLIVRSNFNLDTLQ